MCVPRFAVTNRQRDSIDILYIEVYARCKKRATRTDGILQDFAFVRPRHNAPFVSLLPRSRFAFLFLAAEHLQADWAINYLYWASVPVSVVLVDRPYHCQSISNVAPVRLRQTSRRNQPIYRGTMGQHDSIVSCRLCINRPLSFFLSPGRHLYPVLRTATPLPLRSFNRNSVRGLNQTFSAVFFQAHSLRNKKKVSEREEHKYFSSLLKFVM